MAESQKVREDMSLLNDLFNTLDRRSLGGIADALGESEQAVSRGAQASMATVMGGLASKSDDPSLLRRLLDLVPAGSDASWSHLAGGIADPNSALVGTGKRLISTLFGGSEGAITRALGSGTGLQPNMMSSVLAMCAPMVMGFLGKRVRDENMSMTAFGSLLQREIPAVRAALPAGVADLLWPRERERVAATGGPVVAQTVTPERPRAAGWIVPLILLALIPGLLWLFSHGRRAMPVTTGTANREVPAYTPTPVPKPNVVIPKTVVQKNVNLFFDTGSARLKPQSRARLDQFAKSLVSEPNTKVTVSGYTDNTGNSDANMKLSEARANAVKDDLVHRGIAADRVTVEGYGQENPAADNATVEGRSSNRRVSVGVGER
jgi:outer membrane protein OmpA-like peptidoglycan-associated protein